MQTPSPTISALMSQFYSTMYAHCAERAEKNLSLKDHYQERMNFYERLFLQSSAPLTLNQILPCKK